MLKEEAGYIGMFATPTDIQDHFDRFQDACGKENRAVMLTAMQCVANFYAQCIEDLTEEQGE